MNRITIAAALCCTLIGALRASGDDWSIETVAGPVANAGYMSWTALAIDANGDPHLVYGTYPYGQLMYAKRVSGAWQHEAVPPPPGAQYASCSGISAPSLALDSEGQPHITWYAQTAYHNNVLLYSRRTGTQWSTSAASTGYYLNNLIPSLALTSADEPRIAVFVHGDPGDTLEYAEWTGSTWTWTHLVGSGYGCCGYQPSLALDANDNPHIGWGYAGYFVYCWNDGGAWQFEWLSSNVQRYSVSMGLDSADQPHVVFAQTNEWIGPLIYGRRVNSAWSFETLIADCSVGAYSRLALDVYDRPHVAYLFPNYSLKYAHRTASGPLWVQLVDCGGAIDYCSIATDAEGSPHIAYPSGPIWPTAPAREIRYAHSPSFAPDPPLHDLTVNACQTATFTASAECGTPTYQWRKDGANLADGPTGTGSTISGATTATLTVANVQAADAGAYTVLVTNLGCAVTRGPAVLAVTPSIPVASAGDDQSIAEQELVTLDGSDSSIPCGTPTYEWTQVAGTSVTLNSSNPARPTFTAPVVPIGGETLTFQLVVSDGMASSEADTVNITITNVNHAPVAAAGEDQTVAEDVVVTLDGSASFDQDNDTLTYTWVQLAGTAVALNLSDPKKPTFTAPLVGYAGETFRFELTVSDTIDSAADTVSVLVENVNHLPVASAGADQTYVEGAAAALNGAASSDPDGDALTFTWEQLSGPVVTLIGADTATPSFTTPQVDPGGAVLVFGLTVDDGYGGSATDEVVITVENADAPPACRDARPSKRILWPPNHKMVPVRIKGIRYEDGVREEDDDDDREDRHAHNRCGRGRVTITILSVTQDEPLDGLGDGDTAPDAVIQGDQVLLRAERAGGGNGRVYRITFLAEDEAAGACIGDVTVCVPHSKGRHTCQCVDDGQNYNSLGP
ncbi:MAG: PKD domain-containing protein, partial [Planctomycetota bacterium]